MARCQPQGCSVDFIYDLGMTTPTPSTPGLLRGLREVEHGEFWAPSLAFLFAGPGPDLAAIGMLFPLHIPA